MKQTENEEKAEVKLTIDPKVVEEARAAEAGESGREAPTLQQVIAEQATEDDAPITSGKISLRKILGGDLLTTSTVRRQVWVFLLIGVFMVIYTANRYNCQQDLIKIDKLQRELKEARYKALSSGSQLTEMSRQSNVLEMLKENNDSVLKIAKEPPFKINIPEE